jgi:hypothetical protein
MSTSPGPIPVRTFIEMATSGAIGEGPLEIKTSESIQRYIAQVTQEMSGGGVDAAVGYIHRTASFIRGLVDLYMTMVSADDLSSLGNNRRTFGRAVYGSFEAAILSAAYALTYGHKTYAITPTAFETLSLLEIPEEIIKDGLPVLPYNTVQLVFHGKMMSRSREILDRYWKAAMASEEVLESPAGRGGNPFLAFEKSMMCIVVNQLEVREAWSGVVMPISGDVSLFKSAGLAYRFRFDRAIDKIREANNDQYMTLALAMAMCMEDKLVEDVDVSVSPTVRSSSPSGRSRPSSSSESYSIVKLTDRKRRPSKKTGQGMSTRTIKRHPVKYHFNYYWRKDPEDYTVHGTKTTPHGERYKVRYLIEPHWRGGGGGPERAPVTVIDADFWREAAVDIPGAILSRQQKYDMAKKRKSRQRQDRKSRKKGRRR